MNLYGKSYTVIQRYRCTCCKRVFQLTYKYKAKLAGIKDKIKDMAINGSGVRDTARILRIGVSTVICSLKTLNPRRISFAPGTLADVSLICEVDEQWSYIGRKKNQCWL